MMQIHGANHDARPRTSNVLLSILIPAYSYPDGIQRILASLCLGGMEPEFEIIIHDDSPDQAVEKLVESWGNRLPNLCYKRNPLSLGAARNWNSLLAAARGDFCLLIHHDEYPMKPAFVHEVISELRSHPSVDVLMMDCLLVNAGGQVLRRHLPNAIRSWAVHAIPSYLFKRNVIGPASALVVRRELYPMFDERLQWLVDVEAYFRLRATTSRWRTCRQIQICSLLDRGQSITANLKGRIPEIARQEKLYLAAKHASATLWLSPRTALLPGHILEAVAWALMRLSTRLCAFIAFHAAGHGRHK
jgi:glycosyltransferase involved in cell wall biosynthesis